MTDCTHPRSRGAKRCRSCSTAFLNSDPAAKAKRKEGLARYWSNPANVLAAREKIRAVTADRLTDPIDTAIAALRANWNKRWAESNRHAAPGDNEIWPAEGLHIVALADEDPADRTVLISFGDNPAAMMAISALVHVHNEMIGRPD